MQVVEINLNRRGINTIEVPRQVEVVAGDTLMLKFINMGHPTHVSISAINSQLYTSFIQENLYVTDLLEYEISIKDGPFAGVFDLEVVTGYGTKKTGFKVFVSKKCEPPPQPARKKEEPAPLAFPLSLPVGAIVLGIVLYLIWILIGVTSSSLIIPDLFGILGFLLVLGGATLTWYSRHSS